ncbi:MAG: hypothetical protein AB2L09_01510 [Coriobacteriia bacterium]
MASAKTHPHVDTPSEEELSRIIEKLHPAHRRLYLDMHRLVVESVSGISYSVDCEDGAIGYGAQQFGYDGWGMAAVSPHAKWVSLVLLRGGILEDPDGVLEGTGALVRHVKIRSAEELDAKRDSLRRLLEAAARINQA